MSKPIPTITTTLVSLAALQALAYGSNAVSIEAHAVSEAAENVVKSVERSQVLFGAKADAISLLMALAGEYSQDEITAVNPSALFMAERFVRALPDGVSLPEFSVEPDGSISLDWIESRNRLFSVSVGANSRFAFAWLDGSDKGHGVARFDGQEIPQRIIDGITAIAKNGNTSLRVA